MGRELTSAGFHAETSLRCDSADDVVLRATGLQKVFGDTAALRCGDLELRRGEVHALLGENGAGKSTLIKILSGLYTYDRGHVSVGAHDLGTAQADAQVAFIHQEPVVFPAMTVAENVALMTTFPRWLGLIRWGKVARDAERILDRLHIAIDVGADVGTLPIAARTMIAIAAAVARQVKILVLDEPTASLSANEVTELFNLLDDLRARGLAILFVTHRIDEVKRICDRVTVLRDGATIASVSVENVSEHDLVALIVGHRDATAAPDTRRFASTALVVRGLVADGLPHPLSFEVHAGEVLGLTGSLEAGHLPVGEVLYGVRPQTAGSLSLMGLPYQVRSPTHAIDRGIRYLPPDRNKLGLAPLLSVRENLFMNAQPLSVKHRRFQAVGTRREYAEATDILQRYDVRPPLPDLEMSTLSGGNAQKVLLARTFLGESRLVILSEPTAGVDVGARASIYRLIRQQAAQTGVAVIAISSDFAEVSALCDRCLVFKGRQIVAEYPAGAATVDAIAGAAL